MPLSNPIQSPIESAVQSPFGEITVSFSLQPDEPSLFLVYTAQFYQVGSIYGDATLALDYQRTAYWAA